MSDLVGKTSFQMVKSWEGGCFRSKARDAERMACTVAPARESLSDFGVLSSLLRTLFGTERIVSSG